ncbi:MAG: hypothetical protein QOE55_587 [Acidobacteriaceae bacterium]|jgi:hypothetical protein|nr:hypothetical protein [Acidobacteriaceae bacterium]
MPVPPDLNLYKGASSKRLGSLGGVDCSSRSSGESLRTLVCGLLSTFCRRPLTAPNVKLLSSAVRIAFISGLPTTQDRLGNNPIGSSVSDNGKGYKTNQR